MEIIIGAAVSLVVQAIKKYLGTNTFGSLLAVLVVSLVAAFGYSYLVSTGMWDKLLPIVMAAGGFYAFIIKRFETQ